MASTYFNGLLSKIPSLKVSTCTQPSGDRAFGWCPNDVLTKVGVISVIAIRSCSTARHIGCSNVGLTVTWPAKDCIGILREIHFDVAAFECHNLHRFFRGGVSVTSLRALCLDNTARHELILEAVAATWEVEQTMFSFAVWVGFDIIAATGMAGQSIVAREW